MNLNNKYFKIICGLVIAYFALTVIASEGIVVDEQGKPIKGAHVLIVWQGNAGLIVQPHTRCYKLEATTSDENGKFRIPMYSGSLNPFMTDRRHWAVIFVPGYYEAPNSRTEERKYVFAPIAKIGTRSEQFEHQLRMSLPAGAGAGCGNDKARLPYLKTVHTELVSLATTEAQLERCDGLLYTIERHEFGASLADEKRLNRTQKTSKSEVK